MRKWGSNSLDIVSPIKQHETQLNRENQNENVTRELNTPEEIKVLGISWNQQTDELKFDFSAIPNYSIVDQ